MVMTEAIPLLNCLGGLRHVCKRGIDSSFKIPFSWRYKYSSWCRTYVCAL